MDEHGYKNMQEMVQEMADTMQQFGNPPTYEQLQQIRETSTQLRQSVRDYLAYKQEVHSDTRWERKRIEAAQTLLDLSDRIVKSGDSMELAFAQVPELRDCYKFCFFHHNPSPLHRFYFNSKYIISL